MIKDLIKRLNKDFVFKLNCGFLVSDETPSEVAYSRLLTKLSESNVLEKVSDRINAKFNQQLVAKFKIWGSSDYEVENKN